MAKTTIKGPEDNIKSISEFKDKAKLIITDEFLNMIKYICRKISKVEWSGVVLYEKIGDSHDPTSLTITPKFIFPIDKGSSGYTEYEIPPEFMDIYDTYPEFMELKVGHIHSHNSMGKYFVN